MKKHYWLREDFDTLMSLLPGADVRLPHSNTLGHSLQYPKHIDGAVAELKLRGLLADRQALDKLVAAGVATPQKMAGSGAITLWSKDDIDAAAEYLYDNDQWSPWTHFCYVANIKFGQAVKAYRVAAARYGLGFTLGFDILGLNTVIEPAKTPDEYAWIAFYPADAKLKPEGVR